MTGDITWSVTETGSHISFFLDYRKPIDVLVQAIPFSVKVKSSINTEFALEAFRISVQVGQDRKEM